MKSTISTGDLLSGFYLFLFPLHIDVWSESETEKLNRIRGPTTSDRAPILLGLSLDGANDKMKTKRKQSDDVIVFIYDDDDGNRICRFHCFGKII